MALCRLCVAQYKSQKEAIDKASVIRGFMPLGVAQGICNICLWINDFVIRGFMPLGVAQDSNDEERWAAQRVIRGFMPLGVAQFSAFSGGDNGAERLLNQTFRLVDLQTKIRLIDRLVDNQ